MDTFCHNELRARRDFTGELVGCEVPKRPVRTALIIFLLPSLVVKLT
jgi:hypothetical protein